MVRELPRYEWQVVKRNCHTRYSSSHSVLSRQSSTFYRINVDRTDTETEVETVPHDLSTSENVTLVNPVSRLNMSSIYPVRLIE